MILPVTRFPEPWTTPTVFNVAPTWSGQEPSSHPASAKPWSQLFWTGDGLAARPSSTTPNVTGVPQVTLDAIEVIGRLLLDARGMLMHQKVCPATICGAPVALQHSGEGPFQAIVPAASEPFHLTPINMAVADIFGATNVNQQSWTDRDIEPIKRIFFCNFL
ncbi:hypothetical protein CAEBREN_20983 [Caenorhabditis brenneri]|uniref:Uncharacterized protein n=1 Tax=Caenorhabditis brenneri TaxID=135651 RepID=G0NS27_CAEBE|nr:hypothetical protein CAEBREN_20983 [Caenorhabditis brenneri]